MVSCRLCIRAAQTRRDAHRFTTNPTRTLAFSKGRRSGNSPTLVCSTFPVSVEVWINTVTLTAVHATWVTELGTLVKPFVSQSQDQISHGSCYGNMGRRAREQLGCRNSTCMVMDLTGRIGGARSQQHEADTVYPMYMLTQENKSDNSSHCSIFRLQDASSSPFPSILQCLLNPQ